MIIFNASLSFLEMFWWVGIILTEVRASFSLSRNCSSLGGPKGGCHSDFRLKGCWFVFMGGLFANECFRRMVLLKLSKSSSRLEILGVGGLGINSRPLFNEVIIGKVKFKEE